MKTRGMCLHRRSLALVIALSLAACAQMRNMEDMMTGVPARSSNGLLTTPSGMTLYTFDKDTNSEKSVCNGPCATAWPPFKAPADAKGSGDYSVVTREDGSKQWAYRGKPLYTWSKDQKPGDKDGDGFNKVWHVVPAGQDPGAAPPK